MGLVTPGIRPRVVRRRPEAHHDAGAAHFSAGADLFGSRTARDGSRRSPAAAEAIQAEIVQALA